ncbi:colicin V synthesis protein [Stenotrophomonas daejeonensis]|uniref:Colicin V synthesis protein n=1 Tax=Stenotrophomonas daejeonensis TaxID=659018 RepID=A0A0R0E1I4_9GAMM|nr:CvpA family protein [Stenotrophomonas daejeonensis]KRG88191.1 colicin V synthesis protein [Stenotrophomonas daejeonensis]
MIDMVLLAVIGLSALLGLMKGFVGIVVGTLSWLLSGWAAFQFGGHAARWLAEGAAPSLTHYLGGYALVFVGVLVLVAVTGMLLRSAVDATRLNGTDRALGFGLGVLRGGLFACVLVLLMGFTPLPREAEWGQSKVLPVLLPGAEWMRAQLPDLSMPGVDLDALAPTDLGNLPVTGDNAALNDMMKGSGLPDMVSRALGKPAQDATDAAHRQDPARALPSNIDPAQVRPGQPDPARVEAQGQARPPSR